MFTSCPTTPVGRHNNMKTGNQGGFNTIHRLHAVLIRGFGSIFNTSDPYTHHILARCIPTNCYKQRLIEEHK